MRHDVADASPRRPRHDAGDRHPRRAATPTRIAAAQAAARAAGRPGAAHRGRARAGVADGLRGQAAGATDDAGACPRMATRRSSRPASRSPPRSRRRASGRAACASARGWRPRTRSTWCGSRCRPGPARGSSSRTPCGPPSCCGCRRPSRMPPSTSRARSWVRCDVPRMPPRWRCCVRPAQAADRVVTGLAAGRLVGRTEADVAAEVRARLVDEGHDSASFWIVASGPRSASPHHEPDDRVIEAGEPLLLDIGGRLRWLLLGHHAHAVGDGCRRLTGPDDTFRTIHGLVLAANQAGTAAVRPGVPAQDLDRAARAVIDAAGYGARSSIGWATASASRGTRTPTSWRATRAARRRATPSASSRASTSRVATACASRTSWCAPRTAPDVLNEAPRELLVVSGL